MISPFPSHSGSIHSPDNNTRAEASSLDHASAAQYVTQQEVRPSSYSTTATPTSEYGIYPNSARSGSFAEHIQRPYQASPGHPGNTATMAQNPGNPNIPASSPTYATHGQYSPYAPPNQDMQHGGYPHGGSLYAQPRPDWAGYSAHPTPITPGHHVFPSTPNSAPPQHRPNQVYSFVPIPGAQQHKRPRRRYEEIERMYKCGWNGCEKAYGTLNHLNAHVTMQTHGQKRTPEEFKEIRKEWKARKKEEDAQRKAEDERQRQAAVANAANAGGDPNGPAPDGAPASSYAGSRQLPPLGYQNSPYSAPPASGVAPASIPAEYNNSYMHQSYPPSSPYGPPPGQNPMYGPR